MTGTLAQAIDEDVRLIILKELAAMPDGRSNETILAEMSRTAEEVRAFGARHDVLALTTSPLAVDEEQVRDLVALAFAVGGCTGLYHPFDGRLATYITFGEVTIETAGGATEQFDVRLP